MLLENIEKIRKKDSCFLSAFIPFGYLQTFISNVCVLSMCV